MKTTIQTTEGKIAAAFLNKIMEHYKYKPYMLEPIKEMTKDLDLRSNLNMISIKRYKQVCNWILEKTGEINAQILGREIGKAAYHQLITNKLIPVYANPLQAIEGLIKLKGIVINDPKQQDWKVVEKGSNHIVVRRISAFNSVMHLGLLETLVEKSGAILPNVSFVTRKEWGQAYDEYLINWK